MSPSEPTTPVRVPKAAATYTPTTQDPDLRSQINTVLLRDGHIARIQETLLHTLHASPTNWPTLIQNHALSLLRSGEIATFPQLMSQVMEDIRLDSVAARAAEAAAAAGSTTTTTTLANGNGNGNASATAKGGATGSIRGHGEGGASLAVPKSVLDEGVRITRESLEQICEVME